MYVCSCGGGAASLLLYLYSAMYDELMRAVRVAVASAGHALLSSIYALRGAVDMQATIHPRNITRRS